VTEPLVTAGFHHAALVCNDAVRTVAFYHTLLGLELLRLEEDPTAGSRHLYFGDAAGTPGWLLVAREVPAAPRGGWGLGGVHHVALGTATAETQLRWKRRLMDAGIAVSGPYERGYFRSIYFTDPDEQVLEIATRGPGYAIDEPPDALGRTLMQPPERQLRGFRDDSRMHELTHPEPVPTIDAEMALEGIHHISGITRDLPQAGDFYERALGLRLVKQTVNQDDPTTLHYFWATYDGHEVAKHSAMTLFGWPRGGRTARAGCGQTDYVAFRATDAAQLTEWRDHLASLGIAASAPVDDGPFQSIAFSAPDGQALRLVVDETRLPIADGEGPSV
jgi:glyoxalase family protein